MRVKTKFRLIWSKPIKRRLAEAGLRPFPGTAMLRWVVLSGRGTAMYEGKPSTQAFRLATRSKNGAYILEFDKEAPFASILIHQDGAFQFSQIDWPTWERFHSKKDAAQYYQRIFGGKAGAGI